MKREGSLIGSQVKAIIEVLTVCGQITRLRQSLEQTYQPIKLLNINPVCLEAERSNTLQTIERLEVRREALLVARTQDAKRFWTERGDFSEVQHTGVFINGR